MLLPSKTTKKGCLLKNHKAHTMRFTSFSNVNQHQRIYYIEATHFLKIEPQL